VDACVVMSEGRFADVGVAAYAECCVCVSVRL
jgi:hypothetical protein